MGIPDIIIFLSSMLPKLLIQSNLCTTILSCKFLVTTLIDSGIESDFKKFTWHILATAICRTIRCQTDDCKYAFTTFRDLEWPAAVTPTSVLPPFQNS